MIKTLTFFFLPLLLLSGSELLADDNKEINWKEEIEGLKRELTARHPDLFFYADSASFYKGLKGVTERAPGKNVLEVAVMLQQVVAKLGDANTQVNYNYLIDNNLILPFQCYWFQEGLYVSGYLKDYEKMEGKLIVSINNYPVRQVIDSLATLISGANPSLVRYAVPRMIIWVQLLEYFGFAELPEVEITLEDPSGNHTREIIRLPSPESAHITVGPDPLPLGWQDRNAFFRDHYFPDDNLYYIQYNKCWSREAEVDFGSGASALFMPSFKEFEKKVLKTIRKQEIEKMVIDLRFNSGGNALQGTNFVGKLQKSGIGDRSEIYLMVGRKTFSSAIINAVDVIRAFAPVVVGEDTGGKPNHFGEIKRFVLTTSNLVVTHSTKYFTLMEDDPQTIAPDLQISQTFEGFMKGTDEAMEVIRNHSHR
ncbi:MAG: hypothetical protein R6W31_11835 [Bacteroidales bacterium]